MTAYNAKSHTDFSGYDIAEENGASNGIRGLFRSLAAWSEERRAYRQAVFELNELSDRDLADIGIARCDIQAVARDAAKAR